MPKILNLIPHKEKNLIGPRGKITGLRRFHSIYDLPADMRSKWLEAHVKNFHKINHPMDFYDRVYHTGLFIQKYGREAARKYTYAQRLAIEKRDLDDYNNSLIMKAYKSLSPLKADGVTVDPNKGMGNLELYNKYGLMEPKYIKELVESNWLPEPQLQAALNASHKAEYKQFSKLSGPGDLKWDSNKGFWSNVGHLIGQTYDYDRKQAGAAGGMLYHLYGQDMSDKIARGYNQQIIDGIYAKDLTAKAKRVEQKVSQVYRELKQTLPDEKVKPAFLKTIFPTRGMNMGIPQLAAYYDKNGNILSSEVNDLSIDDMRVVLAKKMVYDSMYEQGTAYDMLDKEAKAYIDEKQTKLEYAQALAKDMAIGAAAYTMDKANSLRSYYLELRYGNTLVPAYMDQEGHYLGREHVVNGIYTDPYSGEKIPVKSVLATPTALDQQGIAPDGTTRGAFFNNKYWSDAEATGMWDRVDQARAKALNGYSPSKAVYKLGEDKDYFWEVMKMAQFAGADMALNLIPTVGMAGGIALQGAKLAQGVAAGAKVLRGVGKGLYLVSKGAQFIQPTTAATGIGHAYGRGVFSETLENNMSMVNDKVTKNAEANFSNRYNKDKSFKAYIDNKTQIMLNEYLKTNGIQNIPSNKKAEIEERIRQEVVQEELNVDIAKQKQSPEYQNAVDKAAITASKAAFTASSTTALKYAFVNNFGYRNFLYKDPFKRANTAAANALKGVREEVVFTRSLKGAAKNSAKSISKKGAKETAEISSGAAKEKPTFETVSHKRLTMDEKFKTAAGKSKQLGKVVLEQMWGGGWTNFTDELQSAGAKRINQDSMNKYLNDDYQAKAEANGFGIMNSLMSYFNGALDSFTDASTWNAGLVGALGSITSFAPNAMVMSKGFKSLKSEWRKAKTVGEKINLLVSNGVLNTYYERYLGEKQAKEVVDNANQIIEHYEEFKDLFRGLALDQASLDTLDPDNAEALQFIKAVQIARQLSQLEEEDGADGLLWGTLQRSSIFRQALETVHKLTPTEEKGSKFSKILSKFGISINKDRTVSVNPFSDEEKKAVLAEYYAKNPQVEQSAKNDKEALSHIMDNAAKLKKGIEVFNAVDEAIAKIEKETGVPIPLSVRGRLIDRFALDQFLKDKIRATEAKITGSEQVNSERSVEAIGHEKAVDTYLQVTRTNIEKVSKEIEKAKSDKEAKDKAAKEFLESKDNALTSDEKKEYATLAAKAEAARLQIEALEETKKSLEEEEVRGNLLKMEGYERRVLTSEEILRLSPEDRARMLDKSNFDNYSKEQQAEITKTIKSLKERDPELLKDIQSQAFMVQRQRTNDATYNRMLENPEAAAAQIEGRELAYAKQFKEEARVRHESFAESLITGIEQSVEDPDDISSAIDVQDKLREELMKIPSHIGVSFLEELLESESPIIQKYRHVIERALANHKTFLDVEGILDGLMADSEVKGIMDKIHKDIIDERKKRGEEITEENEGSPIQELRSLLIQRAGDFDTKQEILFNLKDAAEKARRRKKLSEKTLLDKAATALEELWKQESATSTTDEEGKEKAKEDSKEKQADKEEARLQAEEKAARAAAAGLSSKDADNSNDRAAELGANGLAEKDLSDDKESGVSQDEIDKAVKDSPDLAEQFRALKKRKKKPKNPKPKGPEGPEGPESKGPETKDSKKDENQPPKEPEDIRPKDYGPTPTDNKQKPESKEKESPEDVKDHNDSSQDKSTEGEAKPESEKDKEPSSEEDKKSKEPIPSDKDKKDTKDEKSKEAEEPNKADDLPDIILGGLPTGKTAEQDNIPQTNINEEYAGNAFYEYEIEPLREEGKQVKRHGELPTDIMSRVFNWLDDNGVKLQEIIDSELSKIIQDDPDIHLMFTDMRPNAHHDETVCKTLFLVTEYTPRVQKIHNEKLGGVITSGGKQWLIIGIMSAQKGNEAQNERIFDRFVTDMQIKRKHAFDANPSERFYVDPDRHTKVTNITCGSLVTQLTTDPKYTAKRTLSELLSDEERNPKRLAIEDLVFAIQRRDRSDNSPKVAYIKIKKDLTEKIDFNKMYSMGGIKDPLGNMGSVFLLIEGANGKYIPAYINPVKYAEINEGVFKTEIIDLVEQLVSYTHRVRLDAANALRQYISVNKDGDFILVGTEKYPSLSLKKNGNIIRTWDLRDTKRYGDIVKELLEAFEQEFNPRINVTLEALSNKESILNLDEAGALTTDLAKLGVSGASFNVYDMDSKGNPIIPDTTKSNTSPEVNKNTQGVEGSDLTSAQIKAKQSRENYKGTVYEKTEDGRWIENRGDRKPVTDSDLIEQLEYSHEIRLRELKPVDIKDRDEIYVLSEDKDNPIVVIKKKGKFFKMNKESANKAISNYKAKDTEKEKQKILQKNLNRKQSNNPSSSNEEQKGPTKKKKDNTKNESLTDGQINDQMKGIFDSKPTPAQEEAQRKVEIINADTADVKLSEDKKTYVDSAGNHYARVTSVIAADETAGDDARMPANSPYATASSAIGTGIDVFVRDFFDNNIGNRDNLADRYPNATNEQLKAFAEQLDNLKRRFQERGLTIVPKDVTVTGTVEVTDNSGKKKAINVCGTLDLLAYDRDGNFYIFDMKTMRTNRTGSKFDKNRRAKWIKQLTLYKQLLQDKYGVAVKGVEIIPISVDKYAQESSKTHYTTKEGQLYKNGKEYRDAKPYLLDNIDFTRQSSAFHFNIQMSKLLSHEQELVREVKERPVNNEITKEQVKEKSITKDFGGVGKNVNSHTAKSSKTNKKSYSIKSIKLSPIYRDRFKTLIEQKFPDAPKKRADLEKFLQEKGIAIDNIRDVEDYFKMIENCK